MVSDFNWYLVSSLMTQWWWNSFTSPFATTWMVNAQPFVSVRLPAMASQVAQVVNASKENHKFDSSIPYVHICPFYFFLFYKNPEKFRVNSWLSHQFHGMILATTVQGVTCALRVAGSSTATGQFRGGEGEFWSGVFQEMWTPNGPQMDPKKEASDRLYIKLFFRVSFIFWIQLGSFHFLYMMNYNGCFGPTFFV